MSEQDLVVITDEGIKALAEQQAENLPRYREMLREYLIFYAANDLTEQQREDYINMHTYQELRMFAHSQEVHNSRVVRSVIDSLKADRANG